MRPLDNIKSHGNIKTKNFNYSLKLLNRAFRTLTLKFFFLLRVYFKTIKQVISAEGQCRANLLDRSFKLEYQTLMVKIKIFLKI